MNISALTDYLDSPDQRRFELFVAHLGRDIGMLDAPTAIVLSEAASRLHTLAGPRPRDAREGAFRFLAELLDSYVVEVGKLSSTSVEVLRFPKPPDHPVSRHGRALAYVAGAIGICLAQLRLGVALDHVERLRKCESPHQPAIWPMINDFLSAIQESMITSASKLAHDPATATEDAIVYALAFAPQPTAVIDDLFKQRNTFVDDLRLLVEDKKRIEFIADGEYMTITSDGSGDIASINHVYRAGLPSKR